MNRTFCLIKHSLLSVSLLVSTVLSPVQVFAQTTDTALDAEREKCMKNTAYEWNTSLNRCIQKKEAQAARHEVEDCASLTDMEQRKECHKRIAEKKTGLNSDPDSLPQGSGGAGNMAMINAAYTMIGLINGLGSGRKDSTCTSKKIFGITAMAGTVTDIWLKIKAKKAMDALKNKYQLDVKNNAYDNQSKAFEYLKDEQMTVKDIAGREKKRNMLLMLGYGAASAMAIFEMTPYGQTMFPECYKPEPDKPKQETKPAEKKPEVEPEAPKPEKIDCTGGTSDPESGACVMPIKGPEPIETRELPPAEKPVVTNVTPNPGPEAPPTPASAPKQQFVMEQKNGVTRITSTDGASSIVGNRIIDRSGNVIGTVGDNVEIVKVGTSAPISSSDYKKYGVYSSSATDSATKINFTNSSSGGRTSVNGSTTTINDAKLKRGK